MLCDHVDCSSLGFPVLHYLLEFAPTHVHWVGDAIQPSHSLSPLHLLPSIFPSIKVFSNELAFCIRWPKYWSFNFSISPSNEYSGFVSFRIDWLDLFAVQGTLKSILQHLSSKASILQHSAFFMVQLSHPYMTTRTHIALTIWAFVIFCCMYTICCTYTIVHILYLFPLSGMSLGASAKFLRNQQLDLPTRSWFVWFIPFHLGNPPWLG